MQITNPPQQVPFVTTLEGAKIGISVLDIGVWNMDDSATKSVAHALGSDYTKIRMVSGWILPNAGEEAILYPIGIGKTNVPDCSIDNIDSGDILLKRTNAGFFDSETFDSGEDNRGYLLIAYYI